MKTALGIVGFALVLGGVSLASVDKDEETNEATEACCMSDRALAPEYAAAVEGVEGVTAAVADGEATRVAAASECDLVKAQCDTAESAPCELAASRCESAEVPASGFVNASLSEKGGECTASETSCESEKAKTCSKSVDADIDA